MERDRNSVFLMPTVYTHVYTLHMYIIFQLNSLPSRVVQMYTCTYHVRILLHVHVYMYNVHVHVGAAEVLMVVVHTHALLFLMYGN